MTVVPGLNWTAPVNLFIGQITELDMVSAGLSVIKAERLLPVNIIQRIDRLPKHKQSIAIGKISRLTEFKSLASDITKGIQRYVNMMLTNNNVSEDRILSVKRDAVFITGPCPGQLIINPFIKFKAKHSYTSFIKIGSIEVYAVPKRSIVDIKGIPNERIDRHKDGIIRLVLDFLRYIEIDNANEAAETLQQFRDDYLQRKLPINFYREFNAMSLYAVKAGGHIYQLELGDGLTVNDIEILYNLHNVIIPLAQAIA